MNRKLQGDNGLPIVARVGLPIVAVAVALLYFAALESVAAQPRTMPSQVEAPLRFIRTNLACIYVMGTVQTGLSIAAAAHGGESC